MRNLAQTLKLLLPCAAAVLVSCGGSDTTPFAERCAQLASKAVGPGSITTTKLLDATGTQPTYCQANGVIVSSPTSTINFRMDLPTDSAWNKKLVQTGGGGYNGVVRTSEIVTMFNGEVRGRGYAFVGSDGGVQTQNLSSTLNNPSAFDNFAFAHHPPVLQASLAALQTLYGRGPERKYFFGVSTGGREALQQAQRYPENYDGIVAGEPVIDYSSVIQKGTAVAQLAFSNGGAGWLNPKKVSLYATAQLAECDGLDGLKDGIISNVNACKFDPAVLRCAGGVDAGDTCLSDAQIATMKFIHSDSVLPAPIAFGITSAPPFGIGAEDDVAGLTTMQFGANPEKPASSLFNFSDFWLKYQVTSNVNTTVLGYKLGSDAARWMELSEKVSANNPDLKAFADRGGKLLLWAGASDYLVPPGYSSNYYERVVAKLGKGKTDSFMRFYMLPGVVHGVTGPGAAISDLLGTLENWVEKQQAPNDPLVAAKFSGDGKAVVLTRPMCRYPAWPKYKGAGDANAATSFDCVTQ
jgi:feruloyl esterase